MRPWLLAILCFALLTASACQEEAPQSVKSPPQALPSDLNKSDLPPQAADQPAPRAGERGPAETPAQPAQTELVTPRPPIFEDFQGAPQLTLFPRVGDFRPADDSDRLPFWMTFIDHLVNVTTVAEDRATGNRVWVFRSINSIESAGFFSPLGVEPQTTYQVSFTLAAELPEGASAGIGIIEFNEFLWIPGQYTEETFKQHFRGSHEGTRLTGTIKGEHSFTFTTGPETHMIHVVLFREGTHDRNSMMFDNVRVEEVQSAK